jgi:hypothetical protein
MKLTKKNVNGVTGVLGNDYTSNFKDVYKSKESDIETLQLKGYELVTQLFVDSSGFGAENEPALTASQFERELDALLTEHGTLYSFILSTGMFQVYVGLFKKVGASKVKTVGHATLRIETANGYKIRYHSTDVIEYDGLRCILRNGGWQSVTTKKRINEYLPMGVYISQKNYVWYVHDTRGVGSVVEFSEGMTIKS